MTEELYQEQPTLKNKVFEALGTASMCWETPSGAGVFQSDEAIKVGEQLMTEIENDVPTAIAILKKALSEDKNSPYSYYYTWQANIAAAFYDEYHNDLEEGIRTKTIHDISNSAAKRFLDLLIR